jgi:hypothetical protein
MSKGGSQTTSVEIPEYIQDAAKRNLSKAEKISQLGYVPYYGPDVAAFSPLQEAAMTNVGGQAGAFGLATPAGGVMSGMPAAQEFAGGIRGYSSAPMFEQAQAELAARRPAQKSYIDSFFIDPYTGQYGSNAFTPIDYTTAYPTTPVVTDTGAGTAPVVTGPAYTPATDPYGPTVSIPDVIDAYDTLPDSALPPVVPAVGGTNPQVGDIIDNEVLKQQQNAIVEEAFQNYGDVLNNPNLTPEQKAAANPAFNPEIAKANEQYQDLTSQDFASATGATYVPPATTDGLGEFVGGGTGTDTGLIGDQYSMAGQSVSSAGVRNIGGSYAQSPAGSGDLVETRYDPATGNSEIISVTPAEPVTYDGSSEKNAAVAKILKDQYGWSEETLAEKGYEGYAPDAPKSVIETIAEPVVDLFTPAPSDFETTFEAASASAKDDPTSSYMPTQKEKDFASTVLAADDIGSFLPPTPTSTSGSSSSGSSKIGTDAGDGMVWAKSSTSNALVRKPAPKSSSSKSSSSSSSSSSKILCCAYYNLGYLPRDIWRLDQQYGVWLVRNDPALMEGYHAWAAPLADYVQQDTFGGKLARAVMWPIVKSWASEMAHTMKPEKYKANYAGKAIKFVGEAFSRMCGKLVSRKAQGVV